MRNWSTVFLYELRQQVTRKMFLFTTFGVPLIGLLLVFGYLFVRDVVMRDDEPEQDSLQQEFEDQALSGFVDLSGTIPAPAADSPFNQWLVLYESVEAGQAALQDGDIESLFVLQADYPETGAATHWMPNLDITAANNDALMEAYIVTTLGADLDPALLTRLRYPVVDVAEKRIAASGEAQESSFSSDFAQVYGFAMLLLISLYSASGYLMNSVVQEKESKTVEILLTSVKPLPLMVGKVLAMGVVGIITITMWLGALVIMASQVAENDILGLSNISIEPATVIIALIYFVLGYGFMGAIFAAVGALTNTVREGSSLAGWLVFPVMIPLFVTNSFVENPHGTLPTILSLIPFTAPMAMVMRSAISDVPIGELLLSIALMVVLVMGAIWAASRIFRVNTLLRGNLPKLRDLPNLFLRG